MNLKQQIKLGVSGFLVVLVVSMLSLKPYLPKAIYHNFAKIDDYRIFINREVMAAGAQDPLSSVVNSVFKSPDAKTLNLLADLKTTALVVLENGQVVYESYSNGGGEKVISGSFSMAKSITGLLTGFALQERKIKSLDEPISNYLTEWDGREEGKISIKNLLTMSSGLNWDESYGNPFSITTEAYYGTNLHFTALRQRLISEPGKQFKYQSGSTQLLGLLLTRATNRNLADYASEKLWKPLGAEATALWSLDHEDGIEKAYCCFNATARDFARLGEFVRLGGQWKGREFLDPNYIKIMTTPNGLVDYYGYQWWIYQQPNEVPIPYARGVLGQYIILIPQKNRVVVRLGMKTGEKIGHHPEELIALVKWALNQ